ncbi:MAG: RHS repeat-associated core domain-containing protein [Kofleriaceae bacterium]
MAGAALGLLAYIAPALRAAPGNPFGAALPTAETSAPEGVAAPTAAVAASQGAAVYSIPIEVAPGRLGMQPKLSLDYSSAAALRGGIAAGWSLGLPSIDRDPSQPQSLVYRITMSGPARVLVPSIVDGPGERYRAEWDGGFARIFHGALNVWKVQTPDGITRTFGGTFSETDFATEWKLREEIDPYGNQVYYQWQIVTGIAGHVERNLLKIRYTFNQNAGLQEHAQVDFIWNESDYCYQGNVPKAAQVDHHFNRLRMTGGQTLSTIRISVRDQLGAPLRRAREYGFTYDTDALSCDSHAPLRMLTEVSNVTWNAAGEGAMVAPLKFGYGTTQRTLETRDLATSGEGGSVFRGPTSGYLDLDGDGVADEVNVAAADERCKLSWRRGVPGGGFEGSVRTMGLPSATWGPDGMNLPVNGDSCSLNGQVAVRRIRHDSNGVCETDDAEVYYHFLDWNGDGHLDVLADVWQAGPGSVGPDFEPWIAVAHTTDEEEGEPGGGGCSFGQVPIEAGGQQYCTCPAGTQMGATGCQQSCGQGTFGDDCSDCPGGECGNPWDGDPGDPGGGGGFCSPPMPQPLDAGSNYRWIVFLGNGEGWLPSEGGEAIEVISPRPLGRGASVLTRTQEGLPSVPRLVDIDGDGWQDVIELAERSNPRTLGLATELRVWRGNGGTSFTPVTPWQIPTYPQAGQVIAIAGKPPVLEQPTSAVLVDYDADGLPDLVVEKSDGSLWLLSNMGDHFEHWRSLRTSGPVEHARTELPADHDGSDWIVAGQHADVIRMIDLDNDGLLERVTVQHGARISSPSVARMVERMHGDAVASWSYPNTDWEGLEGLVLAQEGTWRRANAVVDLTGDGRLDPVDFFPGGSARLRSDRAGDPPRLLTTIDNGRGAVTRLTYRLASEASDHWLGGPRYVVRESRATAVGQPDEVSTYSYGSARWGTTTQRFNVPQTFLGFDRVTTIASGQNGNQSSRTDQSFIYYPDASPRELETIASSASGASWQPVGIVTHEYTADFVAGGVSRFVHPVTTTKHTCRIGQDIPACRNDLDEVASSRDIWSPQLSGASVIAYAPTETIDSVGRETRGARALVTAYEVRASGSEYRILATQQTRQSITWIPQVGGDVEHRATLARTSTTYNALGQPWLTTVSLADGRDATTAHFYVSSGLEASTWRPNLYADGLPILATAIPDDQHLYSAHVTNEYGHTIIDQRDIGTGALVRRLGPSSRRIGTNCDDKNATCVEKLQPEEWSVDGLGRVYEHRVAVNPTHPGDGWTLVPIEWTLYQDLGAPIRIIERKLIAWGDPAVAETVRELDGAGRVVIQTDRGVATTYRYDAGGKLFEIVARNPSGDVAPVTTRYTRDGVGRVIGLDRPDGSRETIVRDAGRATVTASSTLDGPGTTTEAYTDPWGRLLEVVEHDNPTAGIKATTRYGYDALDRMVTMLDAEGNTTRLEHDRAGNRTAVVRGVRTWSYTHDLEGNILTRTTPRPGGASSADYTSNSTYDWIGRLVTHTPATRGLGASELAQLGIGTVQHTYDVGANGIGRPAAVVLPFGAITYDYDLRGQVARERREVDPTASGIVATRVTQQVDRDYGPTGQLTAVQWDDGTTVKYRSDPTGRPGTITWNDQRLAEYHYNAAGLEILRDNDYGSRRDRQWDALGRPAWERVRGNAAASLLERTLAYDGQGRVRQIEGSVAGFDAHASYTYDRSGRIRTAYGPGNYKGAFTYTATGNIATAHVSGALDSAERDVAYAYGAVDPAAVDRIASTQGGTFADLSYDPAGNLTRRELAGETTKLVWDGDDQLRRSDGNATELYWLAGAGQRIAQFDNDGMTLMFGESETRIDRDGRPVRRTISVAGDGPVARIVDATKPELLFGDGVQSLALALDDHAQVLAAMQYGAFGELVDTHGEDGFPLRFNGKRTSAGGLRDYGYRSYDPQLLRWTSADPLYRMAPDAASVVPQRANLYTFSLNNPVRYLDPNGLDPTMNGCFVHPEDCEEPPKPKTAAERDQAQIDKARAENSSKKRKGIVYVLDIDEAVGDVEPDQDVDQIRRAGYTVVWVHNVTKAQFDEIIHDAATVGFIIDAHGSGSAIVLTGGDLTVADMAAMAPAKNVKFAYFMVCHTGLMEGSLRALLPGAGLYNIDDGTTSWLKGNLLHDISYGLKKELGVQPWYERSPLARFGDWLQSL